MVTPALVLKNRLLGMVWARIRDGLNRSCPTDGPIQAGSDSQVLIYQIKKAGPSAIKYY